MQTILNQLYSCPIILKPSLITGFLVLTIGILGTFPIAPIGFAQTNAENRVNPHEDQTADTVLAEAEAAFLSANLPLALSLNTQAEALFRSAKNTAGIERTQLFLARINIRQGRIAEARDILTELIETAPQSIYRAKFHNALAGSYNPGTESEIALGQLYLALDFVYRLPASDYYALTAGIYQNIAIYLSDMGRPAESLQYFAQAVSRAENTDNPRLLSSLYNNLGIAYIRNEQFDSAAFYLEKALELAEVLEAPLERFRALVNLGNLYTNEGSLEKALAFYDAAREAYDLVSPGNPSVMIIHNQGRTLTLLGRYQEAEALLKISLAISEEQQITEGIYHNVIELGKLYARQGMNHEALPYLQRALETAGLLNNTEFKIASLRALHRVYAAIGQFDAAYQNLLHFHTLSDSLAQARYTQELALAENFLELSRQREINEILQKQQLQKEAQLRLQSILIFVSVLALVFLVLLLVQMKRNAAAKQLILEELEVQKQKLEQTSRDKDKLFAIVSHDLRNALVSMEGILTLLKEDSISAEEFKALIPDVETAVQENSIMMSDLLTWAKEQLTGVRMEAKPVKTTHLIQEVLNIFKLIAAKKKIDLATEVGEVPDVLADPNALTFVIRNIVSNALKFTAKQGKVWITADEDPEHVTITIHDNGIGMSAEMQQRLFSEENFSRMGTANEKGTGFGLKLSNDFVKRMGGSLSFVSTEGEGSHFSVTLPKS